MLGLATGSTFSAYGETMATAPVGHSFGTWLTARGYQVEHVENAKRACRVHLKSTGRGARSELNKLWLKWSGNEVFMEEPIRLSLYTEEVKIIRRALTHLLHTGWCTSSYHRQLTKLLGRIDRLVP